MTITTEHERRLTAEDMLDALQRAQYSAEHPMVARAQNWANHARNATMTEAWQAIGYKHVIASNLLSRKYLHMVGHHHETPTEDEIMWFGYSLGCIIQDEAEIYLWDINILEQALEAELPPHTVSSDILAYDAMLFVFSRHLYLDDKLDSGNRGRCGWMLVTKYSGDLLVGRVGGLTFTMELYNVDNDSYRTLSFVMEYGTKYPEDAGNTPEAVQAIGQLLKMLAFINSPYVDKRERTLTHTERKEVKRSPTHANEPPNQTVRVVKLRPEVAQELQEYNEDKKRYEATHKHERWWWVRGHNRAQWYPSLKAHQVIWIKPYRKGNLEGDIVQRIYKVDR